MQTQPEKTFDLTLVAEQPGTTTVKISEKDIRRVFPDKSSKTPWWTHAWNIISMIILGIAVILAIYYFDDWWENCYDCYKAGEMSEDLRIKTQEEIEDEPTRAAAIWHSKFGHAPRDAREWARQARFLQGRGFSGEVIRRLLKEMDELPRNAGSAGEDHD